jgi:glycosyltransferase involved in cell wall biosynthesis
VSGKRKTPSGLRAQLYVFEKLSAIMQEYNCFRKYRRDLAEAVMSVARDALADPDLYYSARSLAETLQPRLGARFINKVIEKVARRNYTGFPVENTFAMVGETVGFGVDLGRDLSPVAAAELEIHARSAKKMPKVSVVIPTHNRAAVLPRAIDSVLVQTDSDLEVLVVDDHSSDDTRRVVAAYTDPRVCYIEQDAGTRGVAAARNLGLRKASGEFVAFLDDDDEWFPEKLARQIPLFDSGGRIGIVYSGAVNVYSEQRSAVRIAEHRGELYREMLVRNRIHGLSGVVIRRNIIREVGFFDETLPAIEDYDYWLRICRRHDVDCVSEPLIRYYDQRDEKATHLGDMERRSRKVRDNMVARRQFFRKHGAEMKRFKVAQAFLIYNLKWYLNQSGRAGRWIARELAVRSFLADPRNAQARHILRRCFEV